MKELLLATSQIEKENSETKVSLAKEHISERLNQPENNKKKTTPFFDGSLIKVRKLKKPAEFSSMDRIRIVVDGLIGDMSREQICRKERISLATYEVLKSDFLSAFKEFSELKELQQTLTSKNLETIVKEVGKEPADYFQKFIDVSSFDCLVVSKEKNLFNYSNLVKIQNLVLLDKVNNFRKINKRLEEANERLPMGGILLGSFETFNQRVKKKFPLQSACFEPIMLSYEFCCS